MQKDSTMIMLQPIHKNIIHMNHTMNENKNKNKNKSICFGNNMSSTLNTNTSNEKETMIYHSHLKQKGFRVYHNSNKNTILPNPTPMRAESSNSSRADRISSTTACADGWEGNHDLLGELAQLDTNENQNKSKKTIRFAPLPPERIRPVTQNETGNITNATAKVTTRRPRACTASHTEEERRELWYQDDELGAMKREAKEIIANRKCVVENPDSAFAEREGMVGLERFTRQRAAWKRSAIQYVLMAQRHVNKLNASNTDIKKHNYDLTQEFIRTVARRCTLWAQEIANTQGFKDYLAVHDPLASLFSDEGKDKQDYNELIFGDTNNKDESSWSNSSSGGNKRKVRLSVVCEANEEKERRVRQRTELPPIII